MVICVFWFCQLVSGSGITCRIRKGPTGIVQTVCSYLSRLPSTRSGVFAVFFSELLLSRRSAYTQQMS